MYSCKQVLQSYTGDPNLEAANVKNNSFIIYELLDEMIDWGYPQICQTDVLRNFIKVGQVQLDPSQIKAASSKVTQMVTGAVDWRDPKRHKYRKNEVYIDVLENINVLMAEGQVLNSYVTGK